MRVTYTAGALDAFLDEGVDFPYVIGVSAGANAGSNYVVGQRERNHRVFVEMVADPRYAGWANLLRERSWFGMRFLFETLPDELAPYRYADLAASPRTLVTGVTDCATALPVYLCHRDHDPRWFVSTALRATSSLPVLSPAVRIGGRRCLDGGVSDPIPLARAVADGNPRNVIVLTRNAGYRKGPPRFRAATQLFLARYPAIRRALRTRHLRYNATLQHIEELERAGSAFVLRPAAPLVVGRMERDVAKLAALYRQGYDETIACLAELKVWLASPSRD